MKKVWLKIQLFFANIFGKEFAFLKKNSGVAVKVTNILKDVVQSPLTSIVTSLIPGDVDNQIHKKLEAIIPRIAAEVALAHGIVQQAGAHHEMLAGIIEHVRKMLPEGRVGFWLEFSGRVNYALADGEISFAEAVALAQAVYAEVKN
jgi:hypothetical protein